MRIRPWTVVLGLGIAFRSDSVSPWAVAGVLLAIVGAVLASRREAAVRTAR